MKISVEWLNQYLPTQLTARQMADAMELAGIEVEEIIGSRKLDHRLVVGAVVAVSPHPNADRLRLAKVEIGGAILDVVCGAPNLQQGQKVIVAQVGAVLPGGMEIQDSQIRGERSAGMICSPQELGIGDDHSGILVLPAETKVGALASEVLPSAELIDTATAANRWDLNGYAGIAIEIAAHSQQKAQIPEPPTAKSTKTLSEVVVADAKLSLRYLLAKLSVDNARPTPDVIIQRLESVGIRPISLVVDITNYVMLEFGQPLHAFDGDRVNGSISVRVAAQAEQLTTLDGQVRKLDPSDIVIADGTGAIGLAGVMGGKNSEITAKTTTVLLEAASFPGIKLRQTAQRYGLRTDASARFERGIPTTLPPVALNRAIELLELHAAAKLIAGPADLKAEEPVEATIKASTSGISDLLGIKLTPEQIAKELSRIDFQVKLDGDNLIVTLPWWRNDLSDQADIAEEVIKLVGYDQLPATIPTWRPKKPSFDHHWAPIWKAKASLQGSGLFELTSYSFISEAQITDLGWEPEDFLKLKNPLSREQAYLRRELLPSLIAVAERNRGYSKSFGVYELSKVYQPSRRGELPHEPHHLAVMTVGANSFQRAKATFDRLTESLGAKITVKPATIDKEVHWPARAAEILVGKQRIGVIAQLHPALAKRHKLSEATYFELDWPLLLTATSVRIAPEVSRYPSVRRDIAVIVDRKLTWAEIASTLGKYKIEFLNDYYGDDLPAAKKVVALRATFQQSDRTLTDTEADRQAKAILKILVQKLKAKPR